MFNREVNKSTKKAGVTVELILAVMLAVVVLFFILSIFGDNLKTMMANSNIHNMFNNTNKATYTTQASPQTTVSIGDPAEVPTQITGEQGLQQILTQAQQKIDNYINNPPKNEQQVEDLAKWASIATTVRTADPNGLPVSSISDTDVRFVATYGIGVNERTSSFNTTITPNTDPSSPNNYITSTKTYDFSVSSSDNTGKFLNTTNNQITTVNNILKVFP